MIKKHHWENSIGFTAITYSIAWNVFPRGEEFISLWSMSSDWSTKLKFWLHFCSRCKYFTYDMCSDCQCRWKTWVQLWWYVHLRASVFVALDDVELFQRLFRLDLLVANLFRNFLLAERIMRAANWCPQSFPCLPPTHQHLMCYICNFKKWMHLNLLGTVK